VTCTRLFIYLSLGCYNRTDSSSAERVKNTDELDGETFLKLGRRCKDDIKTDFRDACGVYITGSGSCSLVEFDISGNVISASGPLGSECDVC